MKLKFSVNNHWVAISHAVIVFVGLFIALIFFNFDLRLVFVFLIWFFITEGPGLYLHIEYWLRNKNEVYILEEKGLRIIKNGESEEFPINEIHKIVVYMSPNMYKQWPFYFFSMEQYHYSRVFLKNGSYLYITCLLAPNVYQTLSNLKGVSIKKRKWLFNSTYFPERWY